MKSLDLGRYALSTCAAYVMLSGCGGSQPPIGAPGAMPQSSVIAGRAKHGGSWMLPEAKHDDLLYIAGTPVFPNGVVYVYTYPQGKLFGTLTGFAAPSGECADSAGDVFIVAYSNGSMNSTTIYEYAHGGGSPIATLSDPNAGVGCAIDPKTGNLAVSGDGVAIYQHATGKPTIYYSSQYVIFRSCGYDNKGNLYLVSGSNRYNQQAALLRLAKGSSEFEQISVNAKLYVYSLWPSVQWDGKHMTVSSNPDRKPLLIYRLHISGSTATVVGTTEVSSAKNNYHGQTWIHGDTIVGTGYAKRAYESAFLWPYPAGGAPRRQIKKVGNVRAPEVSGVTVSVGESQKAP